jgi:hypothetical protein
MKVGVVGSGVSGCIIAATLSRRYLDTVSPPMGEMGVMGHLPPKVKFEVDLIHDPKLPMVSVGEGSTIPFVKRISQSLGFTLSEHGELLGATPKFSILYKNFNPDGSSFTHPFEGGVHGLHFNTESFSNFALKNLNCNVVESNIEDVDSISGNYDYVFDCRGFPEDYSEYDPLEYIPVNAVVLCKSPKIESFRHTETIAHKNGWYFAIPLLNETSYGYLYNDKITEKEEAVLDFHRLLSEREAFNEETPEFKTMRFSNYCHRSPLSGNVFRLGFRGSFVEPMEATANELTTRFSNLAMGVMLGDVHEREYNMSYTRCVRGIESFIMWHYLAGSTFKTPFWDFAVARAKKCVLEKDTHQLMKAWESSKNWERGMHEDNVWGFWGMQSIYKTGKGLGFV